MFPSQLFVSILISRCFDVLLYFFGARECLKEIVLRENQNLGEMGICL